MKLSAAVDINQETIKTCWMPYFDEFEVELKYLTRTELREMLKKATDKNFDRRSNSTTETLNPRKFDKELSKTIINWRGLTIKTLGQLVPLKFGLDAPEDTKIECDEEAKLILLENAYGFDKFVQDSCTELANFIQEKQDIEVKNSEAS